MISHDIVFLALLILKPELFRIFICYTFVLLGSQTGLLNMIFFVVIWKGNDIVHQLLSTFSK